MGKRIKVNVGDRFGRLVIAKEVPVVRTTSGSTQRRMLCRCDCGSETVVLLNSLRFARTRSCGCIANEATATRNRRNATHGMSASPEFAVWRSMKQRCSNENHVAYSLYGGRGITVCDLWRDSFERFWKDMGTRPSLAHSIDRIDNDGNYEPGNCRWATVVEQGRNKHNNVLLTHHGDTMCLVEWAELIGVSPEAITARLRRGWSVEDAVTTPSGSKRT